MTGKVRKYDEKLLNGFGIITWSNLSKSFQSKNILLGNGFSLNFSKKLNYKSLFDNYKSEFDPNILKLFNGFETKNFEKILEHLANTKKVCEYLDIKATNLLSIQLKVRRGLINSIHRIHPTHMELDQTLITHISKQFKDFNNIFTTNYDIFLYYVILELNHTKPIGDYFYGRSDGYYTIFRSEDSMRDSHIYYLHGALFIFEDLDDSDDDFRTITYKIFKPPDSWLLDSITENINLNKYPLYISEGLSEAKFKSIRNNEYLDFCYNNFKSPIDKNLIVYGQSLSEQDRHIVNAIDNAYRNVAVSIKTDLWESIGNLKSEVYRIRSLFSQARLKFFDADSFFNWEVYS